MSAGEMGVPDKMTVFQKSVASFNRPNVPADEARSLLTQLVHLFYVGDSFQEAEATQLFFTITRLFQKDSPGLKQMVYLAIKELVPYTDNVIMGTSVLMRDVQEAQKSPQAHLFRPQALRALSSILDAGAVEGMDRLMRSAIVSRDASMSSAALVSAYHLLAIARDSVRRWATEIQDAVTAHSGIAQYHALGLLHEVRGHDPMALLKLVTTLAEQRTLSDPNATVLHIRFIGQLLADQPNNAALLRMLSSQLYTRTDITGLEAAKVALSVLPSTANRVETLDPLQEEVLKTAINMLRAYLESPRSSARFGAIRALNRWAPAHPKHVAVCNEQMEALIADSNQAIATYAIVTLLGTGSLANMDSLIDRVSRIARSRTTSDDFRLVVVDSVRSLAKRFPEKHNAMLDFFSELLHERGTMELKLAIVEAMGDVLHADTASSESLNTALLMLSETIEDSEYPELIVRVLHLLGTFGPGGAQAGYFVRIIYNRIMLENALVRAAAVSALSKFVDTVPGASVLLDRVKLDTNDEVRDRAAQATGGVIAVAGPEKLAVGDLEKQLKRYLDDATYSAAFDASRVKRVTDVERMRTRVEQESKAVIEDDSTTTSRGSSGSGTTPSSGAAGAASGAATGAAASVVDYSAELAAFDEMANLGTLLRTGTDQKLSDADMEYYVVGRVHLFESHAVFQYEVRNNYELTLENVTVDYESDENLGFEPQSSVAIPSLAPGETKSVYIVFARDGRLEYGIVGSTLTFSVSDNSDEYPLAEIEVRPAEFIQAAPVSPSDFETLWNEQEHSAEYAQQMKSITTLGDAIDIIKTRSGMTVVGDLPAAGATAAYVWLSGVLAQDNATRVFAKCSLMKSSRAMVASKVLAVSNNADLATLVVDGV